MKKPFTAAAAAAVFALTACSPHQPPVEAPRMVLTAAVRYDGVAEVNRYVGIVQARHEVDQAFRVGGKIVSRRVDVGQVVREGDVLAVLDDTDYRLAEQTARQQLIAATTQARQAASDRQRLAALKADGSVSAAEEEHADSAERQARANAAAAGRQLELAANRLKYTVLRASRGGVVSHVRFEIGQVVAEGQPGVTIADQGEPEIVVDVPEDHLATFKAARSRASLAAAPEDSFDLTLRELSPQAAAQTRTFRARLKPATPRPLPLGATATVVSEHAAAASTVAPIPASAMTQAKGQPAVWVVRRAAGEAVGTVELTPVEMHGYRNEEVLISGLPAGELVVTAGVHKMAPGLRVALPEASAPALTKQAAR